MAINIYALQLEGIAVLARLDPMSATTTLTTQLTERINVLVQQQRDDILEESHWLVLLAGHLLADEVDGEVPQVPYLVSI